MSPKGRKKYFCQVFSIEKNANWIKQSQIADEFYKALKKKKVKSGFSKDENQQKTKRNIAAKEKNHHQNSCYQNLFVTVCF